MAGVGASLSFEHVPVKGGALSQLNSSRAAGGNPLTLFRPAAYRTGFSSIGTPCRRVGHGKDSSIFFKQFCARSESGTRGVDPLQDMKEIVDFRRRFQQLPEDLFNRCCSSTSSAEHTAQIEVFCLSFYSPELDPERPECRSQACCHAQAAGAQSAVAQARRH
jgi:hypothetical protein